MTAILRVPRSRAALSGSLLVLLGLWGALAPLIGPYFHFAFTPDKAWTFTSGRVWLQVVPGAAVALGGLIAVASANRAFAAFGAWLAALGGGWFVVGVPLSRLWADQGRIQLGQPVGGTTRQVVEQVTMLYGLGAVVVFLAALALGRLAVVGVRDAALAEQESAHVEEHPVPDSSDDTREAPALPRRRPERPESVPATPPEQTAPRSRPESTPGNTPTTSGPGDVRVAGGRGADDTRTDERPGANA
jgi:hypothetical protein